MKTFLKRVSILVVGVLVLSCSSDSSDSSTPTCTPIACLNGGTSRPDCGCNCAIGFTGSNCSTQITPSSIKITKIRVKKFPNLNTNGNNWDSFALPGWERPDIFPALFPFQGTSVLFAGTPIDDSFSYGNDTFDFIPTTPIVITQISQQFTLLLIDDDSTTINPNTFETMGGFNFYLYDSTGGFPTIITLSNATSPYKFELTVSYVW